MLITASSNLDFLITPLKLNYGDIEGTQYSDAVYRTALINAVRYLYSRWGGKYSLSGNDITPTLATEGDAYAIVLAATVIIRGMRLSSSVDSMVSWTTPDLSVSASAKERSLTKMYDAAVKDLNDFFKSGLGTSRKQFMYMVDTLLYPIPPNIDPIDPNITPQ